MGKPLPLPPPFERYLVHSSPWLSDLDIFNRTMYVNGPFTVLRSINSKGGIIFTVAQSFQHIVNPNSSKYKVIGATKVLQIRSETSFGPFHDVLAKVTSSPDPSSCLST
ncbi:MAG: hypothetical protein ACTS41_00685 [Candidatus Hodgkinia cicadicola]